MSLFSTLYTYTIRIVLTAPYSTLNIFISNQSNSLNCKYLLANRTKSSFFFPVLQLLNKNERENHMIEIP